MSEKTYRASAIIDAPVKDCWNLIDSYGEICVHCGCCDEDPKTRTKARVETIEGWISELKAFDQWSDDSLQKLRQQDNIAKDLKTYRDQLRYYKKRLREMKK